MDDATLLATMDQAMAILARLPRFAHACDRVEASWTAGEGTQVVYHPHFTIGRSAHKALTDQEEVQAHTAGLSDTLALLGPAFAAHPHFAPFVASSDAPIFALSAYDLGPDEAPRGKGFHLRLGRFGVGSVTTRHTNAHVLNALAQAMAAPLTIPESVAATQETTGGLVGQGHVPLEVLAALWPVFVPLPKPTLTGERYSYPMGLWTAHPGPNIVPDAGVVLFHNGAGRDFSMRFLVDPDAEVGTGRHLGNVSQLAQVLQSTLIHDATAWVPHPSMPKERILIPPM